MSKNNEKGRWLWDERERMSHEAWMCDAWSGQAGRLSCNWNGGHQRLCDNIRRNGYENEGQRMMRWGLKTKRHRQVETGKWWKWPIVLEQSESHMFWAQRLGYRYMGMAQLGLTHFGQAILSQAESSCGNTRSIAECMSCNHLAHHCRFWKHSEWLETYLVVCLQAAETCIYTAQSPMGSHFEVTTSRLGCWRCQDLRHTFLRSI